MCAISNKNKAFGIGVGLEAKPSEQTCESGANIVWCLEAYLHVCYRTPSYGDGSGSTLGCFNHLISRGISLLLNKYSQLSDLCLPQLRPKATRQPVWSYGTFTLEWSTARSLLILRFMCDARYLFEFDNYIHFSLLTQEFSSI